MLVSHRAKRDILWGPSRILANVGLINAGEKNETKVFQEPGVARDPSPSSFVLQTGKLRPWAGGTWLRSHRAGLGIDVAMLSPGSGSCMGFWGWVRRTERAVTTV